MVTILLSGSSTPAKQSKLIAPLYTIDSRQKKIFYRNTDYEDIEHPSRTISLSNNKGNGSNRVIHTFKRDEVEPVRYSTSTYTGTSSSISQDNEFTMNLKPYVKSRPQKRESIKTVTKTESDVLQIEENVFNKSQTLQIQASQKQKFEGETSSKAKSALAEEDSDETKMIENVESLLIYESKLADILEVL